METGGAANEVCLPSHPLWSKYNDAEEPGGLMYGAEYDVYNRGDTLFGQHLHHQDVPCVVCRSRIHAASMMIPARNACYPGWHQEYAGYLMMSGWSTNPAPTNFLCFDENPQAEPHSIQNDIGGKFIFVEGRCGSLPCPPYVNGRELACVVCTK
jgi:hypothetical protein